MKLVACVAAENNTALAIVQMSGDEVRSNDWEPFTGKLSAKDLEQLRWLLDFARVDESS